MDYSTGPFRWTILLIFFQIIYMKNKIHPKVNYAPSGVFPPQWHPCMLLWLWLRGSPSSLCTYGKRCRFLWPICVIFMDCSPPNDLRLLMLCNMVMLCKMAYIRSNRLPMQRQKEALSLKHLKSIAYLHSLTVHKQLSFFRSGTKAPTLTGNTESNRRCQKNRSNKCPRLAVSKHLEQCTTLRISRDRCVCTMSLCAMCHYLHFFCFVKHFVNFFLQSSISTFFPKITVIRILF